MKFCGMEFAPLNIPMKRRLETLAMVAWFIALFWLRPLAIPLLIYLIFYSKFWWLTILYLIWIYSDRKIAERGSRPSQWVRNWRWWVHFNDYFPLKLDKVEGVELDPDRNYLFCCFPHGLVSIGAFGAFTTNAGRFREFFPHHLSQIVTLRDHYLFPFYRELALTLGGITSSAESIKYLLSKPRGGHVVVLMPGGSSEAFLYRPGSHRVFLRERKGFVRLALQTGAPLVPVVSFGENDTYRVIQGPKIKIFQEFVKKYTGYTPLVPMGRGIFQYTWGILPLRSKITTVVGRPIEVEKIENPTQEQIDELHETFMDALTTTFESQKRFHLKGAENMKLEIL